jgi:uncharacterized metal-binding protein YceD (DUF177 family)
MNGAAPEFSRPVAVATLRQDSESLTLTATADEEAALARRLGVEGVRGLAAEVTLTPRGKGVVKARGHVRATLDRLCVVSLVPLEEAIDERFTVLFRPEAATEAEVALDPDTDDEEPYAQGVIDLGEHVAQTLALALDPWPRAPGARLALPEEG